MQTEMARVLRGLAVHGARSSGPLARRGKGDGREGDEVELD